MNDTSTVNVNDFSADELKFIDETLNNRYGNPVETQRAEIDFGDDNVADCPAIYWEHNGCHFIIAKGEDNKYFSQFFYDDDEQFGTEKPFYDELNHCIMSLLQVQADHELKKAGF
ncbi:MAG: hypothetical protein OQK75_07815 [Gammaproteobacteria bacterium]|nr:hypothetical protein [Gammaproteobacteria bacterium]MCW8987562.1 hypothetical protein [Gammaproteobacteria bacterium]MCW9030854.1 hypothetical protein [Gammaproteobacteria bacterium]